MTARASAPVVPPEVYIARTSGVIKVKGRVYRYIQGKTKIASDHPLMKAVPTSFVPMTLDLERD